MTEEHASSEKVDGIAVLIPAWQPEPQLVSLIDSLLESISGAVIVVDDGSDGECGEIFKELNKLPRVHVLRHGVNLWCSLSIDSGSCSNLLRGNLA